MPGKRQIAKEHSLSKTLCIKENYRQNQGVYNHYTNPSTVIYVQFPTVAFPENSHSLSTLPAYVLFKQALRHQTLQASW